MQPNSKTQLINYVQNFVSLEDDEAQQFATAFEEVKVKKRQFIVQPNFTNKHRSFVVKGAFRTYAITNEGQDHTLQFAIENWWASDFNSYIYQHPATLFIVALEDSTILQIEYEKEQELKKNSHKFETFFRIIAEKGLAFEHRRILFNLTHDAEARYENFSLNFPNFANRVPQYALASYLGMSTEFLSRIRNKRARAKS
ncbi:cAMP-binding domain of CRP or a regulatory subunit of cAMP-dependent protein kinases [Dyadobacter sp. SG02]|uniref:Crp/Fnr family transcriptional regulator n=1 Tax=Dyadobacter sp. SG02 TaxID=1855291 RepID=UPI0008BC42B5|nr:Crp/Fnr family transcriptional regulator [Dyadobacter sp. SG02]SEJ79588.1 cAMP-binding domain of CRP or a regulatory subunit of cAMP-dependent protein kinases [Dyadobacter sp. SG02]